MELGIAEQSIVWSRPSEVLTRPCSSEYHAVLNQHTGICDSLSLADGGRDIHQNNLRLKNYQHIRKHIAGIHAKVPRGIYWLETDSHILVVEVLNCLAGGLEEEPLLAR